jgi:hypothetical protein
MTKSPLTRHVIILLQTPMTETFSRQSRLQPISEHIATHLDTKTEPMAILIKIDHNVVHRFSCWRAPQDLLECIISWQRPHSPRQSTHRITNEIVLHSLKPVRMNRLVKRPNARHAQDSALLMKCIEFYEYTGHKNIEISKWNTLNKTQHSRWFGDNFVDMR